MSAILTDIAAERGRQNAKWGQQNHPDGTGPDLFMLAPLEVVLDANPGRVGTALLALAAQRVTDQAASRGHVEWADILLEEVFEALAEADPARLRAELVQVAAVAIQWVDAIDRRGA